MAVLGGWAVSYVRGTPVQVMLSNGQVGRVRRLADQHTPPTNKPRSEPGTPDPNFDGKGVLGPPAAKAAATLSKHEELTAGWARSVAVPAKAAAAAAPVKVTAEPGQTPSGKATIGAANPTVPGNAGKAPVAVERASPEDLSDFAAQWKRGGK